MEYLWKLYKATFSFRLTVEEKAHSVFYDFGVVHKHIAVEIADKRCVGHYSGHSGHSIHCSSFIMVIGLWALFSGHIHKMRQNIVLISFVFIYDLDYTGVIADI